MESTITSPQEKILRLKQLEVISLSIMKFMETSTVPTSKQLGSRQAREKYASLTLMSREPQTSPRKEEGSSNRTSFSFKHLQLMISKRGQLPGALRLRRHLRSACLMLRVKSRWLRTAGSSLSFFLMESKSLSQRKQWPTSQMNYTDCSEIYLCYYFSKIF